MYLFGHIGITLFLATILGLPLLFAVVGVLLPDIIDKTLFFVGIAPCARFIGHTVFLGPIVGLLTYLITRKRTYAIAITFGAFLHLVEDVNGFMVPWFYPILNYHFDCPPTYELSFTPYIITMEIVGVVLLLTVIKYRNELKKFW